MWPFKRNSTKAIIDARVEAERGRQLCERLKAVEDFAPVGSCIEYLGVKMLVVGHHINDYIPGLNIQWMDKNNCLNQGFLSEPRFLFCSVISKPENKQP